MVDYFIMFVIFSIVFVGGVSLSIVFLCFLFAFISSLFSFVSRKNTPIATDQIYDFLEKCSIQTKINIFNNNLNLLQIRYSHTTDYNHRQFMSPILKDFFDTYEYVSYKNNHWTFSHENLRIDANGDLTDFIDGNFFYIGQHSGGDLYSKKYLDFIFDDDNTLQAYELNETFSDIYFFILFDVLWDKYKNINDTEQLKLLLQSEL